MHQPPRTLAISVSDDVVGIGGVVDVDDRGARRRGVVGAGCHSPSAPGAPFEPGLRHSPSDLRPALRRRPPRGHRPVHLGGRRAALCGIRAHARHHAHPALRRPQLRRLLDRLGARHRRHAHAGGVRERRRQPGCGAGGPGHGGGRGGDAARRPLRPAVAGGGARPRGVLPDGGDLGVGARRRGRRGGPEVRAHLRRHRVGADRHRRRPRPDLRRGRPTRTSTGRVAAGEGGTSAW